MTTPRMGMDGAFVSGLDLAVRDPRAPPADALEIACNALARARPDASARRRLTPAQWRAAGALALAAALVAILAPRAAGLAVTILATLVFAAAIALRLAAALAAACARPAPPRARWLGPAPRYTILCPLYREAEALPGLMAALRALDYPPEAKDIRLVLEADDQETVAAAALYAAEARLVLVPPGAPRTKPKALNYALALAPPGPFVTIYDAEDRPHPGQLRAALDAFAAGGPRLGCVQAPLVIDNARESWIASQFAAEYAILFGQILPFLARFGAAFPLGGTSNHFKSDALADSGGWDPFNVTEDADLGYRLARDGWRLAMIAPPTFEEAPTRLFPWVRQRSRWIKGHLQTWLVLMRNPARAAAELGPRGFWTMQLMLLGGALAAGAHAPLLVLAIAAALRGPAEASALLALAPIGYAAAGLAALVAAWRQRQPGIARAAATMPLYWPLAFAAAVLALHELAARPFHWAKTAHDAKQRAGRGGLRLTSEVCP